MTIHMLIRWYGRNPDMSVNYDEEHHGTIIGQSPADCMFQYRTLTNTHDLARYSPMTIVEIY